MSRRLSSRAARVVDVEEDKSKKDTKDENNNNNNDNKNNSKLDNNKNKIQQQQPIVFQCNTCYQIIGDSTNWISNVPIEMSCISLKNVAIDSIIILKNDGKFSSNNEIDIGSFYLPINCSNCKENIGIIYKTTTKLLDHLRDNYTFYNNCIKSYELGCRQQDNGGGGGAVNGKTVQVLTRDELDIIRPQYTQISQRFALIETVIMQLHEQIESINNKLK